MAGRHSTITKTGYWLLSFLFVVQTVFSAFIFNPAGVQAANAQKAATITVPEAIEDASGYLLASGAVSDWEAYALAKAGKTVPADYLPAVENRLRKAGGQFDKVTDYARIALAVKAAGGNPENIAGYNIIQKIYDNEAMTHQGNNGVIYSLLALDSGSYTIPGSAKWSRDKLVNYLLAQQNADRGWSLAGGGGSSVDITAAALTALAPYQQRADVKQAIEGAVDWLSKKQLNNGGYNELGETSESVSQVIIALSALGIDSRGAEFTKAGGNLLTHLFQYRQPDGGFAHSIGSASNIWATDQALQALAAYNALTNGNSGSYEVVAGEPVPSKKAFVQVHVEGPQGVIAEGAEQAETAYEALVSILDRAGIEYRFADGLYLESVNSVTNGLYGGYWYYNVKRQGNWDFETTNVSGLADYKVKTGDEIYVYYSAPDTQVIESVTLDPVLPDANESFRVKVLQSAWDWGKNAKDVSVASSVYVQIGGEKTVTDGRGIATFANGLPAGTYELEVSGYRDGAAPKIVRSSKTIEVGSSSYATIRVEGPQGTIASGTVGAGNALEMLEQLLTSQNVRYSIVNYGWGKYIKSIQGFADSSGAVKKGWNSAIYRGGKWEIPQTGLDSYSLQPGDQLVVYYSGYADDWSSTTHLIHSIDISPSQPKSNQSFTVTVRKAQWDWNKNDFAVSPAEAVDVRIGSLVSKTNEHGEATFSGLSAGTYTVDVTGYTADGTPKVVRQTKTVTIAPRTGGSPLPAGAYVWLSVIGDKSTGTLLSSRKVEIQDGDTPYSILIKTLGPGRVESSGSGATAYVIGIDGLKEFDKGPLSGWMYSVNGVYKSVSADTVPLKNGDVVQWRYTLDGGKDLEGGSGGGGPLWFPGADGGPVIPKPLADAIEQVGLSYENRKPLDKTVKTVTVLNEDKRMTAEQIERLKEALENNVVNWSKTAGVSGDALLSDTEGEVQLYIPAFTLKEATTIAVQELESQNRAELVSPMYEFSPAGAVFDKPVYISMKTPLAVENLEDLAMAWLDETTGQWIPVPAAVDASTGIVTGMVNHFTKFAVVDKNKLAASEPESEWTVPFADEADISSWAYPYIAKANRYGLMVGTGGKQQRFEPKRNMTRAEFVAVLLRLLNEQPVSGAKQVFSDVRPGSWYYGYVAAAEQKGIAVGIAPRKFAPDQPVTRQEMAVMLARALKINADGKQAAFRDLHLAWPQAVPFIQAVSENGIMVGDDEGRFRPRDFVTREMAATAAVKTYETYQNKR